MTEVIVTQPTSQVIVGPGSGAPGPAGPPGPGVPAGGSDGDVVVKSGTAPYVFETVGKGTFVQSIAATTADALAGTNNTKAMTPATVKALLPHVDIRRHGAVGDGVTNDTAAMTAALAAATALAVGGVQVAVYVPPGRFLMDRFELPANVSLIGAGRESSWLINRSTTGLVFCNVVGSGVRVSDISLDGKRASQTVVGLAALQFAKPNGMSGGQNISGGLTLAAAVTVGATTLTVTTLGPVPVRPGDAITIVQGSQWELLRVAASYNGTALTIPLEQPAQFAATTAAFVSVACTNVSVERCNVYGNGRDAIAFFRVIDGVIRGNFCRDFTDTGIDLPDGGSRGVTVGGNVIETTGRWGVSVDTDSAYFGRVADCSFVGNTVRFLNGGTDPAGNAIDGFYIGVSERCTFVANTVDLSKAGISGFRITGADGNHTIIANTAVGALPIRAGTFGIRRTAPFTGTAGSIGGNTIMNVEFGIDSDGSEQAIIKGNTIVNFSTYGINCNATNAPVGAVLTHIVSGNHVKGGVVSIRFGGTATAGSKAIARENITIGASFAPIVADGGWTLYQDSPTALANTTGATLAALEAEVNTIKARLRSFGVIAP